VRSVARAFNGLVDDLVQRRSELEQLNATLEKRVVERTSELAEALDEMLVSEQRIHTIIDTAQDAFIGVDLDGFIIDWNTQARIMFGWSRSEAIGKPVALIVPERYRSSVEHSLRRFRENGELGLLGRRVERVISDRNGDEIPIEMTLGLVATGVRPFFSIFLHDISMRKKVEQMKNEFIATASHELRTPLTSMRVSLSLLAQGAVTTLDPDAQELADIAHRHCERLVRLVNDMLDIQKIEAGGLQLDRRRQPLLPLIQEAIAGMRDYGLERQVALACECQAGCARLDAEVDHDRLLQVLTNLLSNAIKFSPGESRVAVRLEQLDEHIRISVVDHGSGIPESFRDRIFQRFAQAGGAGGSGLGLSICKGIVEEHGGRLSFTSVEGRGSSFHVDLPIAALASLA
jgi:PAS domain S-box-containing protein